MKATYRRMLGFAVSRTHKLEAALRLGLSRHPLVRKTLRRPGRALPPPTSLFIRITSRCNLRCTLCGQWGQRGVYNPMDRGKLLREELPLSEWTSFIDHVATWKPYVMITGGELLLRDDIVELVDHISRRDMICHINSNSTLLESKAEALVEAGLDFISFSLDAPERINAEITGSGHAFRRVIAGVTRLSRARDRSRARLPVIQMFTVISEKNQGHLLEMAEVAEQLRVDTWVVSFPIFTTPALERASSEIFKRELGIDPIYWKGFIADMSRMDPGLIEDQLRRIKARPWSFVYKQFPPATADFSAAIHVRRPDIRQGSDRCGVISTTPVILPNGDVSTCWDHPDYVVGNITKSPFMDIWNGERYDRFRRVIQDGLLPTCARCTGLYQ